jgi:Putative addiction module component
MSLVEMKQKALELTREEQLELSAFLAEAAGHDLPLSPEWDAEITRRVQNIRNGTAKLRPLKDALNELEQRIQSTSSS